MKKSRLDKFLASSLSLGKIDVKLLLAKKRVEVNDEVIDDAAYQINKFSHIKVNGVALQNQQPIYIMLNKPIGVVSATKDNIHKTVIDLLNCSNKNELHIVGRLDLNTSGLLLLTNDSRWSERLTLPESKVPKTYQVTLQNKLTSDYIEAFQQGMYFEFENITTQPADLVLLSDYFAQVILMEGKYHQIKRMFGRFRNPVVKLHRSQIGTLLLDDALEAGQSRDLTQYEVNNIFNV